MPNFPNIAQKVAKSFCPRKLYYLKYPKHFPLYLAYFYENICTQKAQKSPNLATLLCIKIFVDFIRVASAAGEVTFPVHLKFCEKKFLRLYKISPKSIYDRLIVALRVILG